jgi:hypothetical protein
MPCDSRITQTKMKDALRLADALKDQGFNVIGLPDTVIAEKDGREVMRFTRYRQADAFQTTSTDVAKLKAVQVKYAEIGVRAWAKRKGFGVTQFDGKKMTLVNRRG